MKEEWFVEYIEDRRREPRDDVLTELALAKFPDGTTPGALDVARVATFMFAAGHGTTIDLLSLAMLMLAERPDLQQQLREDRSKITAFIEEMLRFESPIKSNFRMARRTTRIGDVDVQAGTGVLVMNGRQTAIHDGSTSPANSASTAQTYCNTSHSAVVSTLVRGPDCTRRSTGELGPNP